jgi:hypothetical protein
MEYHAFGTISEGKHANYHYLICGVQGDFTKDLVNNPPTHLWTRQLKVRDSLKGPLVRLTRRSVSSLREFQTHRLSTNVAFVFALALVLAQPSRLVSRTMAGS